MKSQAEWFRGCSLQLSPLLPCLALCTFLFFHEKQTCPIMLNQCYSCRMIWKWSCSLQLFSSSHCLSPAINCADQTPHAPQSATSPNTNKFSITAQYFFHPRMLLSWDFNVWVLTQFVSDKYVANVYFCILFNVVISMKYLESMIHARKFLDIYWKLLNTFQ